jgi:hypothetical protein
MNKITTVGIDLAKHVCEGLLLAEILINHRANWPRYWHAAVQAGAELMVAEHDAPSDWRRFARVNATTMTVG